MGWSKLVCVKKLRWVKSSILIILAIVCVGSIVFIRAYSPRNKQLRISSYAIRLRSQIETQAKAKCGDEWQKKIEIKEIAVQGSKWYEIDSKDWVFTVSFQNTDETKQYMLANQKQFVSTGLEFREISNNKGSTIDYSEMMGEYPLIPSEYHSFGVIEAWVGFKRVSLSVVQQNQLVEVLSHYRAVTTEEVAFEDAYHYDMRFAIRFKNDDGIDYYSLGVCIGRDGTEKSYAVSTYSNHCYYEVINSGDLYEKVCALMNTML